MAITENDLEDLVNTRHRLKRARRLESTWALRLSEAQQMHAKVRQDLDDLEAQSDAINAKAGVTKGPPVA